MSKTTSQFRLEQRFQTRLYIIAGFVFVTAFVFLIQLFRLQLLHGYENRILAKKFVSRQEFTIAPRGLIYDRNFPKEANLLVRNLNYTDFVVYPSRFTTREDGEKFFREFSSIKGKPFQAYAGQLGEKEWKTMVRKNESIVLLNRMSRREHERLAEFRMVSSFGEFITNHLRYYSMGPALAHVTGYVGLPSRRELDRKLAQAYQTIGKGGLEARYDQELRGTDGVRVRHRIIDAEEQIAASEQGSNLILTIDRDVQAAAYKALLSGGKRGTVIAMKADTGEIIAMASTPSFDPNILSSGNQDQRSDHYKKVLDHEGFLNIAIQAKIPPASTFKPLVGLAALESLDRTVYNEETTFQSCYGKWTLKPSLPGVPGLDYYCWHSGHGVLNLTNAIANSCNVYFYQLGQKLGPTPIIHFSRAFGLDKKTGIDLPGEIEGFVPDPKWKQLTWSNRWYDGDTINLSIGQGFLEVTPIEVAILYAALANRGKIYRPYILKEVRDPVTNRIIRQNRPQIVKEIPVSQRSLEIIQQGMRLMVTAGTGRALSRPDFVPVAGKTGTVQTRSKREGRNHAWFAGYAPFGGSSDETIVVVVFIEFGMGGSAAAVPVANEVFKAAFPDWAKTHLPIKKEEVKHDGP